MVSLVQQTAAVSRLHCVPGSVPCRDEHGKRCIYYSCQTNWAGVHMCVCVKEGKNMQLMGLKIKPQTKRVRKNDHSLPSLHTITYNLRISGGDLGEFLD